MILRHRAQLLIALGLAGIGLAIVGGSSAEANNVWWVLGEELFKTKEATAKVTEELKLVIAAKGTEIRCAKVVLDGGQLFLKGGGSGELLFSECSTYLSEVLSKPCKPTEAISASVKGTLLNEGGTFYELVAPSSGTTFTTLHFSEPCPLPDEVALTGSLVLECVEASCTSEQSAHVVRQASEASFPSDVLKYMGHTAKLAGKVSVELSDADAGKGWKANLQPEPTGIWKVKGSKTTSTKTITGEADSKVAILQTVAGVKIEYTCAKMTVSDGLLFVGGTGLGELTFTSCQTFLNGSLSVPCSPEEPIKTKVEGSLVIHEGRVFALIKHDGGGSFVTFHRGEECATEGGGGVTIGGSLVVECTDAFCESERVSHLVKQAPAGLFEDGLVHEGGIEKGPVSLGGGVTLSLTGADSGSVWSAD